jgi:hypothetical protein
MNATLTVEWQLVIEDVNRKPLVLFSEPAEVTIYEAENYTFHVRYLDPDGKPPSELRWLLL